MTQCRKIWNTPARCTLNKNREHSRYGELVWNRSKRKKRRWGEEYFKGLFIPTSAYHCVAYETLRKRVCLLTRVINHTRNTEQEEEKKKGEMEVVYTVEYSCLFVHEWYIWSVTKRVDLKKAWRFVTQANHIWTTDSWQTSRDDTSGTKFLPISKEYSQWYIPSARFFIFLGDVLTVNLLLSVCESFSLFTKDICAVDNELLCVNQRMCERADYRRNGEYDSFP